ncbi:Aste57867_18994 [Aphanomyces stellatus]|uniref:Aste57867_18994 protein n=1 Tax=Aphanomyces stellatus TaxID=120398 RepID=A0A485LDG1_9STRA|nr:hypothetical protein As57867_018930 [Aphanomyces stellatus]VFT95720.1 Aste57867_18994 [Aphanomyces stellatus]
MSTRAPVHPVSRAQAVSTLDSDYDDSEYETLYADPRGSDLLKRSNFFNEWLRRATLSSPLWFTVAGNRTVQVTCHVANSLVQRWTNWQLNWQKETLRSFLEVLVWTSVTAVAYSIHRDVLWAAQIGFSVGLAMSICDDVFVAGAKAMFQTIQQDSNGAALLRQWGFDVPAPTKASSKMTSIHARSGDDVLVIKNVIFGALALETMRHVYLASTQDIQRFAGLTTAMGVAFVCMGELFCLWLPTRRLGLTVQSRWTNVAENWHAHFRRSLLEVTCYVLCLAYVYLTTASVAYAVLWSSLLGIGLCIVGGLDPLDEDAAYVSSYWSHWGGSGWMDCAALLVSLSPKP